MSGAVQDGAGQLLDLLATDPDLSNRELARRFGLDHHYVAGFRAALALTAWGPPDHGGKHGPDLGPTLSGHCWVTAIPTERTRFVDAVGISNLLAAAPPKHREAFRRAVVAEVEAEARKAAERSADTGEDLGIPADLSIPDFLLRAREERQGRQHHHHHHVQQGD